MLKDTTHLKDVFKSLIKKIQRTKKHENNQACKELSMSYNTGARLEILTFHIYAVCWVILHHFVELTFANSFRNTIHQCLILYDPVNNFYAPVLKKTVILWHGNVHLSVNNLHFL